MKKYPEEWRRIQELIDKDFKGNERKFCSIMNYRYENFWRDQQNQALPLSLLYCMYSGHGISSDYILHDRGDPYYRTVQKPTTK
jgi:hypothetical protein